MWTLLRLKPCFNVIDTSMAKKMNGHDLTVEMDGMDFWNRNKMSMDLIAVCI